MSSYNHLSDNDNMRLKKFAKLKILLFLIFILSVITIFFLRRDYQNPNNEIHFHAGFLVYVNGKLRDFSDPKYMEIESCTDEKSTPKALSKEEEQLEKAHLHDSVGDVVHVHRKGAVWGDLFKNIGFTFPQNQSLSAFQNGKEIQNFLSSPITPFQSIIIVSGDTGNIDLGKSVSLDHIKQIESSSESCAS